MLDKISEKVIPINNGIFSVAQFAKERKLNEKYAGNLVVYPTGKVREISKIKILGYYGESLLKKIFSILNSTYTIEVELASAKETPQSIIEKTMAYLKNDLNSEDPYMPMQELDKLSKNRTDSLAEFYAMLNLPNAEDCLDVMV